MPKKNLAINGMSCANCAQAIEKGLNKEKGIHQAKVNLSTNSAILDYDDTKIDDETIFNLIENLGYTASDAAIKSTDLKISGMSCVNCINAVEKSIAGKDGVKSVNVNLTTETATVEFDTNRIRPTDLIKAVKQAGYSAELVQEQAAEAEDQESNKLKIRLIASIILSFPLMLAMVSMIFNIHAPLLHNPWVQLIFTAPIQFIIGWKFYKTAYHSLRAGSPGMDVLVALGTSSAFFFSIYTGFFKDYPAGAHPDLYFEASGILITLILLGKYFVI